MTGELRLIAAPHPLKTERSVLTLPAGCTVAEMVAAAGVPAGSTANVYVDDWLIPRDRWHAVRPQPGRTVTIRAILLPTGGGDGKNPLAMVLQIAVVAAAAWISGGGLAFLGNSFLGEAFFAGGIGATVAAAAVGIGGALLINALVPPPTPQLGNLSGSQVSNTYAITGSANRANPYGAVPFVAGRHKIYPPFAAQPYSELVGDDQYYRMLFAVYGPVEIEDLRIGETPIEQFDDVEVEIRQGYVTDPPRRLFSDDVAEDSLSILLEAVDGYVTRTSAPDADELSVDIQFPQGLARFDDRGDRQAQTVQVEIQAAPAGTGAWETVTTLTVKDKVTSAVRRGHRWSVARGQYDVRLRRVTADTTNDRVFDKVYWTALRSIRSVDPIQLPGVASVALRIRATDQLNGVLDQFNAVFTSILPDWDGSSWVVRPTSNPASIYRAILQHHANKRPVADDRIDLAGLAAWHEANVATGREFNAVFDTPGTVFERLRAVAAVGRAAFGMADGKYSVVRDIEQTVPIQHFTPRNSWGFRGTITFPEIPHGLKVRFINADAGYQQDERIVYDDGYSAANATKFEVLELFGVTDADQAWKAGRYYLACLKLRRGPYELHADIENLVCTRGDLIRVTHDVLLVGLGSARVKTVTANADGDVTAVTLDDVVTMEEGKTYGLKIRLPDNREVVRTITTVAGEHHTVTFTAPIAAVDAPAPGDLAMFGESGRETADFLLKAIEPGPDFTAKLILVEAAPEVHQADQGPIPPYDSGITLPPELNRPAPAAPVIEDVISDESVMYWSVRGTLESRILVQLRTPAPGGIAPVRIEGRFRETGSEHWATVPPAPIEDLAIGFQPASQGVAYDLQIRYVSREGRPSRWTSINAHVVAGPTHPAPQMPRVTGLELFGQANRDEFTGRDAKFVWRDTTLKRLEDLDLAYGADAGSRDAYFKDYLVRIRDEDGTLLREEHTLDPSYIYSYEKNVEDGGPRRAFTIEVFQRGTLGQLSSTAARLSVSNPPPAMPSNLSVTGGIGSVFVSCDAPADLDWEGMRVWVSDTPGFTPDDSNLAADVRQNSMVVEVAPDTEVYVRVALYDGFGKTGLNISPDIAVRSLGIIDPPEFVFEGLVFEPNSPEENHVSWTAGTAHVSEAGETETYAIAAGSAAWTTGTLYLYYVAGETELRATTQIAEAIGTKRMVVASYRGGTQITVGNGKAFQDGALIIAGTVGAQQMVTGQAVITEAAQIAAAIIQNAHIAGVIASTDYVPGVSGWMIDKDGDAELNDAVFRGTIEVKSAAAGERMEIRNNRINVYDSNGTLRVRMGQL